MIFYITKTTKYMSIEEAMMGGIVFKGKKDKPKEENKIKYSPIAVFSKHTHPFSLWYWRMAS